MAAAVESPALAAAPASAQTLTSTSSSHMVSQALFIGASSSATPADSCFWGSSCFWGRCPPSFSALACAGRGAWSSASGSMLRSHGSASSMTFSVPQLSCSLTAGRATAAILGTLGWGLKLISLVEAGEAAAGLRALGLENGFPCSPCTGRALRSSPPTLQSRSPRMSSSKASDWPSTFLPACAEPVWPRDRPPLLGPAAVAARNILSSFLFWFRASESKLACCLDFFFLPFDPPAPPSLDCLRFLFAASSASLSSLSRSSL
mmetsp:Transcript_3169/g.9576  ORF Transcript_3169/g.9576 Transcript_3169/m.9576 type:complete len:262 (+) Transcript_3169:3382-4167(+)